MPEILEAVTNQNRAEAEIGKDLVIGQEAPRHECPDEIDLIVAKVKA